MTNQEYADFEWRFDLFMQREGLCNLSTVSNERGVCEPYFSWSSCACCDSPMGGGRYDCDGWSEIDGVREYEGVCEDCVVYAEHGKLDDATMLSLS